MVEALASLPALFMTAALDGGILAIFALMIFMCFHPWDGLKRAGMPFVLILPLGFLALMPMTSRLALAVIMMGEVAMVAAVPVAVAKKLRAWRRAGR